MSLRDRFWLWLGGILFAPPCNWCGYDGCHHCNPSARRLPPDLPDWDPDEGFKSGCAIPILIAAVLAWTAIAAAFALIDHLLGARP